MSLFSREAFDPGVISAFAVEGHSDGEWWGKGGWRMEARPFFSKLMPNAKLPLEITKPTSPRASAIIDRSYVLRSLFER